MSQVLLSAMELNNCKELGNRKPRFYYHMTIEHKGRMGFMCNLH